MRTGHRDAGPFTGHSCGKVILLGEHAVVYGRPALAAGIDRGVHAIATNAEAFSLHIEPWGVSVGANTDDPLGAELWNALRQLLDTFDVSVRPLRIDLRVDLPPGAGLGCSAAMGVAVARAVHNATGCTETEESLEKAALSWERVFHGTPSGIDHTVAARGGVVVYQIDRSPEMLKLIDPLHLVIADTGEPSSTRAMVDQVSRSYNRARVRVEQTLDAIAALVQNGQKFLITGDWNRFGQLMDLNQTLLNTLLVSTSKLEELCSAARDAGAYGAKLTGAGGGGSMIALVDAGSKEGVVRAVESAGATTVMAASVGGVS